jgi:hypothetical protein
MQILCILVLSLNIEYGWRGRGTLYSLMHDA